MEEDTYSQDFPDPRVSNGLSSTVVLRPLRGAQGVDSRLSSTRVKHGERKLLSEKRETTTVYDRKENHFHEGVGVSNLFLRNLQDNF